MGYLALSIELYLINEHNIMSPRKKATPKVVKAPKVVKKVNNVVKAKITIEDVVEFFKKNHQYLVKETYYGRYSFFLDNDFNIKK